MPQLVVCHAQEHPKKVQTNMTLPPDLTQCLAHSKAHEANTQNPTLQRAKNANMQPIHPADEFGELYLNLNQSIFSTGLSLISNNILT